MEIFKKVYESHAFEAELTKAQLLRQCSVNSNFNAPTVIAADEVTGVIEYELVDCSQSIMDALADSGRSRESILSLLATVGSCLGLIHAIEPPTNAVHFERSTLFDEALASRQTQGSIDVTSGAGVLQHGDFGFTNIYVSADESGDDQLTIIDPSPNSYLSVHPLNVDYPELDLAVLVSHLIGRASSPVALGRSAIFGRAMVDSVVIGYELTGSAINRDRLRAYTRAGIDAVRTYASDGSQAHRRAILKPLSAVLARNIS